MVKAILGVGALMLSLSFAGTAEARGVGSRGHSSFSSYRGHGYGHYRGYGYGSYRGYGYGYGYGFYPSYGVDDYDDGYGFYPSYYGGYRYGNYRYGHNFHHGRR